MQRIHVVGVSPRSGTTLLAECMITCFEIDAFEKHESPICAHRRDVAVYLTKKPDDIHVVGPRLRIDRNLHVIALMRDPRDIVVSKHHQDPDVYWAPLRIWKSRIGIVRRLSHQKRFMLIRYEDLVREPDAVQESLTVRMPFLEKKAPFSAFHALATPSRKSLDALGGLRAILPVIVGCLVLGAALVNAPRVEAASRTWDGGGADNNWSTPANWSSDTLPVAGDTVTFNATSVKPATIDVPVTIAVFQMSAGYTGTVTQSSTLNVTTSFTQAAGTFVAGGPAMGVTGTTTVSSGGAFNGGSSPITLTGGLTVSAGGAFTSTSGTLTVTGAVTFAAGVFTHNGGTVVFSTSNVTLNWGGAATFNNVQFLSGIKTFSAANTMTVLGTLTLTGGTVNTGTIAAQGNIVSQSAFTGGTTTLLTTVPAPRPGAARPMAPATPCCRSPSTTRPAP